LVCRLTAWIAICGLIAGCNSSAPVTPAATATSISTSSGSSSGSGGTGSTPPPPPPPSSSVTLAWVAPTTLTSGAALTDLAGYRLYYGTSPDSLDHALVITDPSVTSVVITALTPGVWYFAASAFDTSGLESSLSNVAQTTIS
jgi:hypothetical protein